MNIWDADKLVLFVAFAIPGFIALKAYELMFPGIREDPGNQIVDAVAYSCINYALLIWPVVAVEALGWRAGHPVLYGVFWLFVLFVAPVLWSFLWGLTRTRKFFQRALIHPIQKPWDFLFAQRKAFWVKIVLNDGLRSVGSTRIGLLLQVLPRKNRSTWKSLGSLTTKVDLNGLRTAQQVYWF